MIGRMVEPLGILEIIYLGLVLLTTRWNCGNVDSGITLVYIGCFPFQKLLNIINLPHANVLIHISYKVPNPVLINVIFSTYKVDREI